MEIKQDEKGITITSSYNPCKIYEECLGSYDYVDALRYTPFIWKNDNVEIPKRYIINKGATILFWEDGSKTIVKRCKGDKYDKRLGFLIAYFQKHSGMSRNKANKYLDNLEEENGK